MWARKPEPVDNVNRTFDAIDRSINALTQITTLQREAIRALQERVERLERNNR